MPVILILVSNSLALSSPRIRLAKGVPVATALELLKTLADSGPEIQLDNPEVFRLGNQKGCLAFTVPHNVVQTGDHVYNVGGMPVPGMGASGSLDVKCMVVVTYDLKRAFVLDEFIHLPEPKVHAAYWHPPGMRGTFTWESGPFCSRSAINALKYRLLDQAPQKAVDEYRFSRLDEDEAKFATRITEKIITMASTPGTENGVENRKLNHWTYIAGLAVFSGLIVVAGFQIQSRKEN